MAAGSATTATNGSYQISGLASGSYSLSISEPSHVPTVLSGVSVSPGGTAAGSTSLASTGSTLTLTLSAAGGSTVLPSVQVGVEDSTGTTVQTVALGPARNSADLSDSGTANLAPGPYTLVVSQPGAAPTTQLVTLAAGGTTVAVTAPAHRGPARPARRRLPTSTQRPTPTSSAGSPTPRSPTPPSSPLMRRRRRGLSASQLLKAWLGLGGQTLTRLPDDNDALAARLQADQSIDDRPHVHLQPVPSSRSRSVLKIYAEQKDSAFQDWVNQNNDYLHQPGDRRR